MTTSIRYLRLLMHTPAGQKVPIGYLSAYGDLLRVSFDDAYIDNAHRPILSLAYCGVNEAQTQAILRSERDLRVARIDGKLPVYFQNLLPEGHNRERLAKERQCGTEDEFELLAAAGHDLMGAIEVEPLPNGEAPPDSVRLWHTTLGKDVIEPGFVDYPVANAAAIPGVVVKFSAVQDGRRYVIKRHGVAGSYILKLPTSLHPDLVQNEATGFALLNALHINCAAAEIISKDDADLPEQVPFAQLLAVKRFDRGADGKRIHMEEFAQILQYAPKHKYGKNLMQDYSAMLSVLEKLSSQPAVDTVEFIKRFIAYILMGNCDAHLKNWAVIYPDGRHFTLAPAYDPVCVASFFTQVPDNYYALNKAIDVQLSALTWDDVALLLTQAKVLRKSHLMRVAKNVVKQAKTTWPAILETAPIAIKTCIAARLNGGVAIAR